MKKKQVKNKKESGFDKLARLIKSESEDIRTEIQEFREETNENFREIREEVRDIRERLEKLEQKIGNMSGYSKEIDHPITRVARIEKHLGMVSK